MKWMVLTLGAFVAGCVSSQSVVGNLSAKYAGNNVDAFFVDHGAPAGRHQLNSGDIIWTWDSGATGVYMPATTTITGTNYGGLANYTATTYGGGTMALQCVVQIVAAQNGTIKSIRIMRDTIGMWTTSMCHEVL